MFYRLAYHISNRFKMHKKIVMHLCILDGLGEKILSFKFYI